MDTDKAEYAPQEMEHAYPGAKPHTAIRLAHYTRGSKRERSGSVASREGRLKQFPATRQRPFQVNAREWVPNQETIRVSLTTLEGQLLSA